MSTPRIASAAVALAAGLATAAPLAGQWTNRYPKVAGLGHHVYLEGYELPLLTIGPVDPAPSPDGKSVVVASRGWLWSLDLASGAARRITAGPGIDSRPALSPDGQRLAFVRDDTRETSVVVVDRTTGRELVIPHPGIDLDPSFSADGRWLYFSSAIAGDLDIWRMSLAATTISRVTSTPGLELQPIPLPDGERLVYIAKRGTINEIRVRTIVSGEERVLQSGPLLTMLRMALAPNGRTLAFTWPASGDDGWELRLLDIDAPEAPVTIAGGRGRLPLTPSFTPDGRAVLYAEAGAGGRMHLERVRVGGGRAEPVAVQAWDWAAPTGTVRITTRMAGASGTTPARIGIADSGGHPLVANAGQPRFDGQNGKVFFYSPGTVEITAPVGEVVVQAVRGLATPLAERRGTVRAGAVTEIDLTLTPVWDAHAAGWLAGEHHFHLNYGGPYRLVPENILPMARAEAMDVLTPLLANLHTRFEDQPLWSWHQLGEPPWIAFGQEVRSHFLGHLGLVGTAELHWPWIWGPGYEVYGRDDRPNGDVLAFSRNQGGLSTYVHPIRGPDPFDPSRIATIPVELIADGILGEFDALEVACLWSDELGSAEVWYRLLNLGVPIALTAGTDVMNNFYRTMAIGTTRVYVRSEAATGYRAYLDGLKAGRSFVTTGPMLDFAVGGQRPGDIIAQGGEVGWTLDLHTAVGVDSVEILVNGAVTARFDGRAAGGSRRYEGRLRLPAGGWVAARALGGATDAWPAMDSYAFAHTSPVWIGSRGSTTPATRRAAAQDLRRALDAAAGRLHQGYGGASIPALEAQFARARARLDDAAR